MKEDVLEQIVDDYLQFSGYFTIHNVRFKPSDKHPKYDGNLDRVPSDVDVVGFHPRKTGTDQVIVVSCKSWQGGLNPRKGLTELREGTGPRKRPTWHSFRELWMPKWSEAFRDAIHELTGASTFTYKIAVTRFQGKDALKWAQAWSEEPTIRQNLRDCSVGFLTLEEMWAKLLKELKQTPAPSEIGRLAQLLKAAGLTAPMIVAPPSGPAPGSDAEIVEEQGIKDAVGS